MLKKKQKALFALFLAALPFLFSSHAFTLETTSVKKVIDGNTLQLSDGRIVRLLGVSAPEIHDAAKNYQAAERKGVEFETFQIYGFLAKKLIRNLVEDERVWLTYDSAYAASNHRDEQGRILAYVWFALHYKDNRDEKEAEKFLGISTEERLLNAEIIKQGHALADVNLPIIYRREFEVLEQKAKQNKAGFWRTESQSYDEILARGQGARLASVAPYIPQSARALGLESARKTFSKLVDMDPKDYRAYYERSWLGADPFHNQVGEQNLIDLDQTLALAPREQYWNLYLHRHYLLRLLGRHAEAIEAYEMAVKLFKKKLPGSVFYLSKRTKEQGVLRNPNLEGHERFAGFLEDGYRAAFSGEHFLFFMARFKELSSSEQGEAVQRVLQALFKQNLFHQYYKERERWIHKGTPHQLIYLSQYCLRGWEEPDAVLQLMERPER